MLEFISAVYNEENEIDDLIQHVWPYVDKLNIVDDGSTDATKTILANYKRREPEKFDYQTIEHTGLCEVARIKALEMCEFDSWVLMLDADERAVPSVLEAVKAWPDAGSQVTHMYFRQLEFIDGLLTNEFAKVKLFKKSAAHLPEIIHRDPTFDGEGIGLDWTIIHRKTSNKQKIREAEYLETYQKLLDVGKITEGDMDWFKAMHYYVR